MQIKAVLFDMFDTLVLIDRTYEFYNPAVGRMHRHIVKYGVDVPFEEFYDAYVKARDKLYADAEASLEEPHFDYRIKNALQLLGYNYDVSNPVVTGATSEFCQEFSRHVKVDQHSKPVLQDLCGKYKLGIVSNFAIPECVDSLLNENELDSFFDAVVVSAKVNKRKPSPEIFQNTLKSMGIQAKNAVFVGDTADTDVAGAHAVGMKSVYIKRRTEQTLERFKPDVVIECLADLPSALKNFEQA
jgi:HAD superfamily hydrolase (TIGR01662 family)